jgi:hypothetical protein
VLKDDYSFSDTDLMLVQQSAQVFYKVTIALYLKPKDFAQNHGLEFPFSCTALPYDYKTYTLSSDVAVGSPGGPSCSIASSYLASEDALNTLIDFYFSLYSKGQEQYSVVEKVKEMDFSTKSTVMSLIIGRLSFDGEMAGSGAAQDPLFWVVHGAVERLLQKSVFANILSDTVYATAADEACSGHMADSSKAWLQGFYFQDANVQAETLSNTQLADVLNPTTDMYAEMISYVYADSGLEWCDGAESWFV